VLSASPAVSDPPATPPPAGQDIARIPSAAAKMAIVIDDMGNTIQAASELLEMEVPITIAIMPFRRYTKQVEQMAVAAGVEIMVHMPMQPIDYPHTNCGRGALLLSMSDQQIINTINSVINDISAAKGLNNHMCSAFTQDPQKMAVLMQQLKDKNMYFVDSRTTTATVALDVARAYNVPATKREVFLDNTPSVSAVQSQLRLAVKKAKMQGSILVIGHPYPETIQALRMTIPEIQDQDIQLVYASELCR